MLIYRSKISTCAYEGVRTRDEAIKDFDYGIEEMAYGGFERCFHIPRNADVQKMHAKYDNGLLDISIPLTKTGPAKQIPIEGARKQSSESITRLSVKEEPLNSSGAN